MKIQINTDNHIAGREAMSQQAEKAAMAPDARHHPAAHPQSPLRGDETVKTAT